MKRRLALLFLLWGQITFGQTGKLTKIPGTKCSLIPPGGFVAASNFSGFQNVETGSSIMVNEIPGPYQSLVDGFTADALKARGMNLVSKEIIDFNNSKATLINITQSVNGATYLKQMLVFGDAKSTVLVNGIYPETSKDMEAKIKEALLSTIYDASQKSNSIESPGFSVGIEGTDFKLVKSMPGNLAYSADGKMPTEKSTLIVASSLGKTSPENRQKYAEERLKKLPRGEFNVVKEINKIAIDNLDGYEIVADGKTKEGKPALIYQVMLFSEAGEYYLIVGQANEEFPKYLSAYKKIAKTFQRK